MNCSSRARELVAQCGRLRVGQRGFGLFARLQRPDGGESQLLAVVMNDQAAADRLLRQIPQMHSIAIECHRLQRQINLPGAAVEQELLEVVAVKIARRHRELPLALSAMNKEQR